VNEFTNDMAQQMVVVPYVGKLKLQITFFLKVSSQIHIFSGIKLLFLILFFHVN
jgi:hypothetical protein